MSDVEPESGGGWISGPSISPADQRPSYSPTALVWDLVKLLQSQGISVVLAPERIPGATTAAADFLVSVGVKPTNVPRLP